MTAALNEQIEVHRSFHSVPPVVETSFPPLELKQEESKSNRGFHARSFPRTREPGFCQTTNAFFDGLWIPAFAGMSGPKVIALQLLPLIFAVTRVSA
jgi:hypothetical protein